MSEHQKPDIRETATAALPLKAQHIGRVLAANNVFGRIADSLRQDPLVQVGQRLLTPPSPEDHQAAIIDKYVTDILTGQPEASKTLGQRVKARVDATVVEKLVKRSGNQ